MRACARPGYVTSRVQCCIIKAAVVANSVVPVVCSSVFSASLRYTSIYSSLFTVAIAAMLGVRSRSFHAPHGITINGPASENTSTNNSSAAVKLKRKFSWSSPRLRKASSEGLLTHRPVVLKEGYLSKPGFFRFVSLHDSAWRSALDSKFISDKWCITPQIELQGKIYMQWFMIRYTKSTISNTRIM